MRPGKAGGGAAHQPEGPAGDPQVLRGDRSPRVGRRPGHARRHVEALPRGERSQAGDEAARDLRSSRVDHRPLRGRGERHRGHRHRELLMESVGQLSVGVVAGLVIVALAFDFMNGFHDAANGISTVVSTRVLKPYQAVLIAALMNFVAVFVFHLSVASTVGKGIIDQGIVDHYVVLGALIGAISWNIITWYYGIPSSSSHALIGGLVGAGVAKAGTWALIPAGILKTVAFIFLSPLLGLLLGSLPFLAISWIFVRSTSPLLDRMFPR